VRAAHTVDVVRTAERALMATVPDGTLMQRAAAGLAANCAQLLGRCYGARVVVLAGSGDNGGDALYAGARLAGRGAEVVAVAAGSQLHPGGTAELRGRGGRVLPAAMPPREPAGSGGQVAPGPGSTSGTSETSGSPASAVTAVITADAAAAIAAADLIIDGLTGIGGRGGLREPGASLASLVGRARRSNALVVAVDLPSGVDADTGEVSGPAVAADATVTFGTFKPGLLVDPGASHAGTVELVDIGLGSYLPAPAVVSLQAADVAAILPEPSAESDKYRRGVLGLLAGSEQYTGAAVLSAGGAIRAGAGMIRLISAAPAVAAVRLRWPEVVLTTYDPAHAADGLKTAGRVQAYTVGPGLGTDATAHELLAHVLASDLPVLVDADGLTVLSEHLDLLPRHAPTLITPHAGELARLLRADRADIEARRLHYARAAAAQLGVTVLLKGSTTVIAPPEAVKPVLVNTTGSSWLATAGSGDVLSGMAGSLLAQGADTAHAAAAAAFLHGIAARLAARDAPIGASDLFDAIPAAIRTVREH
jgi:ADP-dependent NAD(P)H-hydrate dehydratase / NAD(P)H-hydrate epimerase